MRTRVEISTQVEEYIRALAPEPGRALGLALRGLVRGKGDVRSLEGDLAEFSRLRVGVHRVVFHVDVRKGERAVRCEFAEQRSVIYEVFAEILKQRLVDDGG